MNATGMDYKPATVVDDETACPIEVLEERLSKSRTENASLLQAYHNLWYESGHTWHYTHFLGVGLMKCPNDLWIYQDILSRIRPSVVIETGTYQGGSALWFAFLMDMLRIKNGRVVTIDIRDWRKTWFVNHPRITYLLGNSADPKLAEAVEDDIPTKGRRLIVLDSDHTADHVRRELELYAPLCRVGDWLVVEDTNIGWATTHQVERLQVPTAWTRGKFSCSCGEQWTGSTDRCPNAGDVGERGARGGLQDYVDAHPGEFVQDLLSERYLLTMNPGGWLYRVKACSHA